MPKSSDWSSNDIRRYLLGRINGGVDNPSSEAALHFGVTTAAINSHLRAMASEGTLQAIGSTRRRRYHLTKSEWLRAEAITSDLKEDAIWQDHVRPLLADLPENVRGICMYGFTEILNNAVDHSGGETASMVVRRDALKTQMIVADNGVGIFQRIKEALDLDDERYAILELAKGKLTTDPSRHSGEGIFFSSRAFDHFAILSGRLTFMHYTEDGDWQIEDGKHFPGTFVTMTIANDSRRTMGELYDRFATDQDRFAFSVTHIPVNLAQIGPDNLISRSQGKRLVARFERFQKVILNFKGVEEIGQAFADEVFRVFPIAHPGVELSHVGANEQVLHMISRALVAKGETPAQPDLFSESNDPRP